MKKEDDVIRHGSNSREENYHGKVDGNGEIQMELRVGLK